VNEDYRCVRYFEEITCRDCGEDLVENRKGELARFLVAAVPCCCENPCCLRILVTRYPSESTFASASFCAPLASLSATS